MIEGENMKKKWGIRLLSILILTGLLWSLGARSGRVFADADPIGGQEGQTAQTASYSLSTITSTTEVVLNGSSPSYNFYIPVPQQWKLTGMTLHLQVNHSDVLRQSSTLTAQVNNTPVDSLQLTDGNASSYQWDVVVPAELLTGDLIQVSLVGFMRISDVICDDIENAANWVRIAGDSSVDITYEMQTADFSLDQLPYPLIQTRSLVKDQVVIVTPSSATGEEMTAVFAVAGMLGASSTWRGLDLSTVQTSGLTDAVKADSDLILIGTIDRLNLSTLGIDWSLPVTANQLTLPGGSAVAEDAGVVMVATSPWNAEKAVIAITGKTPAAVTKAALAFRNTQFANLARGKYAVIAATPQDLTGSAGSPDWSKTDLEALGYADQKVNGIGDQTINIPLDLPNGVQPKEIKVTVVFNHAPFVSSDRSYLVLSINGIPQAGLYLNSENEKRTSWNVTVPVDQLVPGKNVLSVLFTLHMANTEVCTDDYYNQAWAVLNRQTSIEVAFDSNAVQPDLGNYPSPFGQDTLIVLPKDMGDQERQGIFQVAGQLGVLLGSQAQYMQLVTVDTITADDLKGHSLILVGTPADNSFIAEAMKSAPVQMDTTSRTLKNKLFDLSVEDGQTVGMLQELTSPWDESKSVLLITGADDQSVGWASELLSTGDAVKRLSGNVALVDEKNGLTLLNTYEPDKSVSAVTQLETRSTGPSSLVLEIVLVALLVVIVVLLIVILVRRRVAKH
jgi:hypothetical protein